MNLGDPVVTLIYFLQSFQKRTFVNKWDGFFTSWMSFVLLDQQWVTECTDSQWSHPSWSTNWLLSSVSNCSCLIGIQVFQGHCSW